MIKDTILFFPFSKITIFFNTWNNPSFFSKKYSLSLIFQTSLSISKIDSYVTRYFLNVYFKLLSHSFF